MDKLIKLAEAIAHHFRYPDENNAKGRSVFEGDGFTLTVDGLSMRASWHVASAVGVRHSWSTMEGTGPVGRNDELGS